MTKPHLESQYVFEIVIIAHVSLNSIWDWWEENRPSSTDDDSDSSDSRTGRFSPPESIAETTSSIQVQENLLIQAYEDELQSLQKSNIELKSKYHAAKTKLKRNPSHELEAENRWLEKKVEKCRAESKRRQTSLEKLKIDNTALKNQIITLENELQLLKDHNHAANNRITELETDFHANKSDQSNINNLKGELKTCKWRILQLQSENKNIVETYERDLEKQRNEIKKLRTENDVIQKRKNKFEKELQEKNLATSCMNRENVSNSITDNAQSAAKVSSKTLPIKHSESKTKLYRSKSARDRYNSLIDGKFKDG